MAISPGLLEWRDLPEWQKEDNSLVRTGYRIATPSLFQCIATWSYLHNESVNIYSHLIGAIIFYGILPAILYQELSGRYPEASHGEITVFCIYIFGVAICYTLSVIFHTLTSHSPAGFSFGIQLDFQGIIVLMWSATAPLVYYSFRSERTSQLTYWSLTSLFAVLASIITFAPAFRKPKTRPLRAAVFGCLALSTLIGVIHGLVLHGWREQSLRFPMWSIGLTLLFNTIGAVAYVLHFPERWWPRTFDIFGASHQLMHCFILVASLAWLAGMIKAFDSSRERFSSSRLASRLDTL